jgi:hypothetical protein
MVVSVVVALEKKGGIVDFINSLDSTDLRNIFEMLFMICFGVAWPSTVIKSFRTRTAKGKSLVFVIMAWIGYVFGISAHIVGDAIDYPLIFYCVNITMVSADLILYFRNRKLDILADQNRQV